MKAIIEVSNSDKVLQDLTVLKNSMVTRLQQVVNTELKARTPYRTGNARKGWRATTSASTKAVENTVPYIQRLEQGWSQQAPRGFVNQSVQAAISQVDKEFTNK